MEQYYLDLVSRANTLPNPLASLPPSSFSHPDGSSSPHAVVVSTSSDRISFPISHKWSRDTNSHEREQCMRLLRDNMREMYEATSWGWREDKKQRELFHSHARLLLCQSPTDNAVVAFVHYRFDMEAGLPAVYCYEIQVSASLRGQGVGRYLLNLLKQICVLAQMHKIIVTVFKINQPSLAFFKTNQFTLDAQDPQHFGTAEDNVNVCYHILSWNVQQIAQNDIERIV